jgi:hypothetical protein
VVGSGLTLNLLKLITMTKLKIAAGAIAVAAVGTTLVCEQQAQARLRQNNEALRQQVAQYNALGAENEQLKAMLEPQTPREPPLKELSRLRAEVAALRPQIAQLTTARPAREVQAPPASGSGNITRESYQNIGFAEPDSALQTMMWAGTRGDARIILASYPPEVFESEANTDAKKEKMVEVIKRCTSQWSGYRVVDRHYFANDRLVMTVEFQTVSGKSNTGRMKLRRVGPDWKMDGEMSADGPLKPGTVQWSNGVQD